MLPVATLIRLTAAATGRCTIRCTSACDRHGLPGIVITILSYWRLVLGIMGYICRIFMQKRKIFDSSNRHLMCPTVYSCPSCVIVIGTLSIDSKLQIDLGQQKLVSYRQILLKKTAKLGRLSAARYQHPFFIPLHRKNHCFGMMAHQRR